MKKLIFFVMLTISTNSYSQECQCIKTPIIGTNVKPSYNYNNNVVAMEDTDILLGETIRLTTQKTFGNVTWYKEGVELLSALVSPTETTEYTVISTLGDCPVSIDKVRIRVKSPSIATDNTVSVYPVPARNSITLSTTKKQIKSLRISNLLGTNILNINCTEYITQQTIDISKLETGYYIGSVFLDDNTIITCKIVKN